MKPILFNTEMVRAILEGLKTVTRRVVKLKYSNTHLEMFTNKYGTRLIEKQNEEPGVTTIRNPDGTTTHTLLACIEREPPYRPGDILYVRETWCDPSGTGWPVLYKADMPMHWDADDTETGIAVDLKSTDYKWRPSIHMPREAARIFLRVESVRVERLQNITDEQAKKEGAEGWLVASTRDWDKNPDYILSFRYIWNNTVKKAYRALYGWDANPWVWVIEFERISREEAISDV